MAYSGVYTLVATEVLQTLHPGATGLRFIIKVWLVTLKTRWPAICNMLVTVNFEMHRGNWNSAKSWWNVDFWQYRNDVCPVMAFWRRPGLLVFIPTTLHVLSNPSVHVDVHVCMGCRKVTRPKPDLPDCLLWSCNVCISTKWLTFLEASACTAAKWVWFTCVTESKRLECEFRQCAYK